MRNHGLRLFLAALVAGCGGAEKGGFSPLIEPQGSSYDLTLTGIDAIREASLAPGAAPGRPKIEGDVATRLVHFLATYSRDVTPEEIARATLKAFREAGFARVGEETVNCDERAAAANVSYETDGVKGGLRLELSATERPNVLELRYAVREERR